MPTSLKKPFPAALAFLAGSIVMAACDGATEPRTARTDPYAAHIEAVSPTALSGTVGSDITPAPTVRVIDQFGAPLPGIAVTFWVGEMGLVTNTSARTDVDGLATVGTWRLGTRPGTQTVKAVLGGAAAGARRVLFTALANPGPAASFAALDSAPAAPAGSKVLLRFRLADAFNNPLASTLVTFAIASGNGSLALPSADTDSLGIAQAQWIIGTGAENSVTASVSGLESVRVTATVLEPPLYYELVVPAFWIMPQPSWIELGAGSRFTTSVSGLAGSGEYAISGGNIVFSYSTDFLNRLGTSMDWWAYPYSFVQETGSMGSDTITLRRCTGEDCWQADWTFHRKVR